MWSGVSGTNAYPQFYMEMSGQFHAPIISILEMIFCLRAECKVERLSC